jgi:hypothetical protein
MNDALIFAIAGTIAAGLAIYFATQGPKKGTNPTIPAPIPKPTPTLNWPDRRPIGMVMLASHGDQDKYAPGDRKWYIGGQRQFSKDALMAHGRESVKNLHDINAQGVIVWDGEGQEYWHPVSYIGDPRRMPVEMNEFADEFFALFKEFRTGVTIRPDDFVWPESGPRQMLGSDPLGSMVAKITYARQRWGCSVFYIDSNVDANGRALDYRLFKQLAELFPDCLLIPEHQTPEYYGYTAPYEQSDQHTPTHGENGFMVMNVSDTTWSDAQLAECVKQGNILMGRVWWPAPELDKIKKAYENK